MNGRVYAYVVSIAVCVTVASPIVRAPFDDGFPLSTYPMFSRPKPSPILVANYAVGLDAKGKRYRLTPRHIGTEEVLQARAILDRTVHTPHAQKIKLCYRVAERVAARGPRAVNKVQLVRGKHNAVEFLTGRDTRGKETVWATCNVLRHR